MAGVADKNALKAGIFITASIVLALIIFFFVTGTGFLTGKTWTVRFDLVEDVSGIEPGAEVRVGGLKRGQVDGVGLSDDAKYVDVKITLPDDLAVKQGVKVAVQSTVTGIATLNFSALGDGDPLDPKMPIDGDGGSIGTLVDGINQIVPTATGMIRHLQEQTLPKADGVLDKTSGAIDNVNAAVGENRPDLRKTMASLAEASGRAPKLLDDLNAAVSRVDTAVVEIRQSLEGTGTRLDNLLKDATTVAGDLRQSSDTVRGILVGNRGKIEQIIARARDASSTLNLAASEIRRSPWRLLYKPDGKQRESLDLYDAARRFAEGANSLQDAAVALQDVTGDKSADPQQVTALLKDLQDKFDQFDQVQAELFRRLQQ